MSTSTVMISTRRNNIQTAIASFVGMALALPVALLIFSATQPASALQSNVANNTSDEKTYALYAQAFTQGFLANSTKVSNTEAADVTSCEAPKDDAQYEDNSQPGMGAISVHDGMAKHHEELVKHISNSYLEYKTTNITNHDSSNTVKSVVNVSHSNGAVVTTGTSTSGDVSNDVEVHNEKSNNTANVNSHNTTNSHNQTSTNTNVVIDDSFNKEVTTNIDNSKTIKDSFNKELNVDVKIKDTGNTTLPKPHGYSS